MNTSTSYHWSILGLILCILYPAIGSSQQQSSRSDQLAAWRQIMDDHKGAGFNRDTLRKYSTLYLDEVKDDPISKDIAEVKSIRLIAQYRLPSDEYNVLAYDLVNDYRKLEMYPNVITELYYVANKMHTAGLNGSIAAYDHALEELQQYKEDIDAKMYCRLYMMIRTSKASNYDYLGLFAPALRIISDLSPELTSCTDSIGVMTYYRSASAIMGNALKKEKLVFEDFPELENKMDYFLKENLRYATALNKPRYRALALFNNANRLYDQGKLDSAELYLQKSLAEEHIKWMPMQRYYSNMLLSDIEKDRGRVESSYSYLLAGYDSARELKEPRHDFLSSIDVARWYIDNDQVYKALSEMAAHDTMMMESLELRSKYHEVLTEIYEKLGRMGQAHHHLEEYHRYRDSIQSQDSEQQMAFLINEYDRAEQDKKITELREANLKTQLSRQRWLAALGGLLLLSLAGGIYYFYRQKNRELEIKSERTEVEQRLFRSQMNPHFIFNTLGSIQSFLLTEGKSQEAAYHLAKFAKLMRKILSQSQYPRITLKEEIETLQIYLTLQKLRFENRFDFDIQIDERLDVDDTYIPPMILQPIVENAIEHGKIHSVDDGKVIIKFDEKGDVLAVSVTDNGVGLDAKSATSIDKGESYATKIINKRLGYLASKYGDHIRMTIESINPGTRVQLSLPHITH